MEISWDRLKEPFPVEEIEWRVQASGIKDNEPWAMVLAYVSNRAVMERLDEVCGPGNWRNEYQAGPAGGVVCGLSIRIDGEWVTKWDGAENTDFESVKGGLSSAMKRAAVLWGIGRYLYRIQEAFVRHNPKGSYRDKIFDKRTKELLGEIRWDPPNLPSWALPRPVMKSSEPGKSASVAVPQPEELPGAETGSPPEPEVAPEPKKTMHKSEVRQRVADLGLEMSEAQRESFWSRIKARPTMEQEKVLFALQQFGMEIFKDLMVTKTDAGVEALVVGCQRKAARKAS